MRNLDPKIKRQEIIRAQLWTALQGDVLGKIRSKLEDFDDERNQRSYVAANEIKVSGTVMPKLNDLLCDVKSNLSFTDDIELFITIDTQINAYSYASRDNDQPHQITLTSALVSTLNDDEIKYMLGHEIGHIINRDNELGSLYRFIYKNDDENWEEDVPEIIKTRYREYNQLAEYAADRYGYLACMNLQACVSSFYKGLGFDIANFDISFDALLQQNAESLRVIESYGRLGDDTHPMRPYRIQALVDFAMCKSQLELEVKMDNLFSAIPGFVHDEMDNDLAMFVAASGLKIAMADGNIDETERDLIVEEIAKYELEASKILNQVQKMDVDKLFNSLLPSIQEADEDKLDDLISFAIKLAFADHVITDSEIAEIMEYGNLLGKEDTDIYTVIADEIKTKYCSLASGL